MALLRILHPFPSLLVTAVTLVLIPIANAGEPARSYLALGLGMLLYQFSIAVTNDVVDYSDDLAAGRAKPLVAGRISRRRATLLAAALAVAGLLITLPLAPLPWLIGAAGLACGLAYDLRLKRTPLSWLPYAIAFPLVPVWVFLSVEAWDGLLWWVLPLGVVLGASLHLANQAADVTAGNEATQGLPGLLGARGSTLAALGLFAGVGFAATAVLAFESSLAAVVTGSLGLVTLAAAALALRLIGVRALFPVLGIGAAGLAIGFLSAV